MTNKFYSLRSLSIGNGSGLDRRRIGDGSAIPCKLFTLLFVLFLSIGQMWGTDATMAAGTNGSTATVSGADAIKVGTSKKGGTMTITVPSGANVLHLKAAAWNGVSELSLNITPTNKVGTTSIALTANSGIANNSPFTFSGDVTSSYMFDIPLTSISTSTTLTFTSSAEKRFVVWGAKVCYNPTALTNGTITSNSARVSWTDSHNVNSYDVYRSTSNTAPAANATPTATVTNKYADLTGLNAGTTYYWWVRAKDGDCKTNWIAGSSFTTTAAAFTITAQSNNTSYGTVSGTTTITASPKSGYRVSTSNPYSVFPANSATVSQNGNAFTVTPSANTTITINFEEIPSHNIIFHTGDLVNIASVPVKEGVEYTVSQTPAASLTSSCEYGTFVGWTTSSSIANASIQPTLITNNKVTMSSSDINLYAVYSKTTGGGSVAAKGTVLWAETWASATTSTGNGTPTKDDAKASNNCSTSKGTTMYGGATISYSETDENVYCRAENTGGGTSPELLLSSGKEWTISGIPTGGATELTLTYASNNTKSSVTCSTTNVTIDGSSKSYTIDNSVAKAETITLVFGCSGNTRIDNVSLTVETAGSSGTTTYSLDPNCCESLGSINGSVYVTHFWDHFGPFLANPVCILSV